jgi:hypothetical protein
MAVTGPTVSLGYRLDRARRAILAWLSFWANAILLAGTVLVLGVGSAVWLIETGTQLTTQRNGPWTMWIRAGQPDLDPYTRARQSRHGHLPLSARLSATWEARFDNDGRRLHSSCEYLIESEPIDASWFSFAVYDDAGLLIPNPAERYGFTNDTLAANPDGSFFIVLAREARPGNWLPVGGAGRLAIVLTMIEPKPSVGESAQMLPSIRRIACR